MKTKLVPGAELDLITESELRKLYEEVKGGDTIAPARLRGIADGLTTAAGALLLDVYRVPSGMGLYLTRLLVRSDGASFAAPFNGAGAMLEILRDELVVDGKSLVAAASTPDGYSGLPALFTYGRDAAAWFGNDSAVQIRLTAGPASTNIVCSFEGILEPIVVGN